MSQDSRFKRATIAILCTLIGVGCVAPAPPPTTAEQPVCRDDADRFPGGHPIQCTPLGQCTDANFQNGTCCQDFGNPGPAHPVPNSIHCGNYENGQAYCTAANEYFLWDHIICVTTTIWTNGEAQAYTNCYVA